MKVLKHLEDSLEIFALMHIIKIIYLMNIVDISSYLLYLILPFAIIFNLDENNQSRNNFN